MQIQTVDIIIEWIINIMANISLKTKNLKLISFVLIVDAIFIWAVLLGKEISDLYVSENLQSILSQIIKEGIFYTIAIIAAIILSRFIPHKIKEFLISLRWRNALPGCRAFSKLVYSDPRIDIATLKKKTGIFPSCPHEQNALWYKFLKQHESKSEIQTDHQNYLFFRDMASISMLMLIVVLVFMPFYDPVFGNFKYIVAVFAGQYLLFAFAGRNAGIRFVQTVLAIEAITQ